MLKNRCGIDGRNAFKFFKDTYDFQLKTHSNFNLAFQLAQERFLIKYGFKPYECLDDYLSELFSYLNGFQLLKEHL